MNESTGFIIVLICIGALLCVVFTSQDDYNSKCREAGGVPLQGYYTQNCAKQGYIDIDNR